MSLDKRLKGTAKNGRHLEEVASPYNGGVSVITLNDDAIDTIQANTEDLLGNTNTEGRT